MDSKCNRKTTGRVSVPVGFRFHPTEEELVNHYLRKKKQDKDFKVNHIIPEIAFCKHEPWDLPGLLFTESGSWEEANVGGGGASMTKRPRNEEGEEGAIVPPPTIHPERMKDFLDTARLVLSGEMSWEV
ncbi:hypothetical protein PRUPE_2G202600 [Prunus persica]|uniref:NAC domain-containing protein n=1 Tax=Prunus persica TaxID=3760 RepID=A0A251QIN5_PRUPE|nr:NAC domain-containing protein 100-like [Prunus persica]ONI23696.1 hypothetical protein PRUPE_2G202600 [Prunus persica]